MDENLVLMEWCFALFVTVGLLLAFLRAQNYWYNRFYHTDPLVLEVDPRDIPNNVHRFSLRSEK